MINAICTWGDGPDVLLRLDGTRLVLLEDPEGLEHFTNGFVMMGQLDLTIKEARNLAENLIKAADEAERMDSIYIKDL